ncbi:MAG: MaoC/PaaZ C-terminal domain-containing protein [Mycolicibacter algericus]|uniref:MaoC/PaaZ C-terminal domain-containing protein n=1 Tax=Mycolicibacter algericus TaxID=1288388 RepID=UPI003C74AF5F
MAAEITEFDVAGLNVWADPETFEVTRERIAEYAAATNDPIAAHLAGDIAPPVFAIVPAFDALMAPVLDVVPIEIFGRIVHGEQDFHFHRPIRPGDRLTSRARVIGYDSVDSGARVSIHLETRAVDGELVNEQYLIGFFRGVNAGAAVGEQVPDHRLDTALRDQAPVAKVVQHVDTDQTFRYSPASGDPMPIHLDEQVARDAGLPGIIAHGLCTMAFTSWAVLTELGGSDVNRLKRLAVRFSKMVLPGDDLETRVWKTASTGNTTTYAFDTGRVGTDELAITDGLAVIAD